MCERKNPHATMAAAKEHLARLRALPDVTDAERLHIYWCLFPTANVEDKAGVHCHCTRPYPASNPNWCSPCGRILTNRHLHVGHRRKYQQRALERRGLL